MKLLSLLSRPKLPFALLAASCLAVAPTQETAEAKLTEPLEVTEVIDGDTIWVARDGRVEKLRLLSVDTEEKITGRPNTSRTKPQTVYGQECAEWAKEFFAALADEGEPTYVRLLFPEGREKRDVYGRLLCHVVLMDGRDFNLLLVEEGKSPYFNKYGNSLVKHDEFRRAQTQAQAKALGIWNPRTNEPATPGAPAAKRPYKELLPWWQARADAIDQFRKRSTELPDEVINVEDVDFLELSFESHPDEQIEVFGEIARFYDEDDGSLTVQFRSSDRNRALRARISARGRTDLEAFLRATRDEFRQNFVFLRGKLERGSRGLEIQASDRVQWRLGGPEPKIAMEAGALR